MATTFDRFSDLPRELRDQIWASAIRAARPGVHIFAVNNCIEYGYRADGEVGSTDCCWHGHHLAAPSWDRFFDDTDAEASGRNVSTYLIDGGLWTACKESRLIMEKHFSGEPIQQRNKHRYGADKLVTTYFNYNGGAPHYFTVSPHEDLFVLQLDSLGNVDWGDLQEDLYLGSYRVAGGHGKIRNLAIEYNPEWGIQSRRTGCDLADLSKFEWLQKLIKLASWLEWDLWFIDHNLKRKKNAPAYKEKGCRHYEAAFYASDRKFLQVRCDSQAKSLDQWEYIQQVGDGSCTQSSIVFVYEFHDAISETVDPDDTGREEITLSVGLLGWDDL